MPIRHKSLRRKSSKRKSILKRKTNAKRKSVTKRKTNAKGKSVRRKSNPKRKSVIKRKSKRKSNAKRKSKKQIGGNNIKETEFLPMRSFIKVGDPPYMGVELEVEFKDKDDLIKCKNQLLDKVKNIQIVFEKSIGLGFEIVTDPMNIQHHVFLWRQILPLIKKYNGHCTSKCGLHIHIDKTDKALENIPLLFNNKNKDKLELIGKRKENQFCKYPPCFTEACYYKGKNAAVNIREYDEDSIEIRIFRCSIIFKNILKFLKFANDIMLLDSKMLADKYSLDILKAEKFTSCNDIYAYCRANYGDNCQNILIDLVKFSLKHSNKLSKSKKQTNDMINSIIKELSRDYNNKGLVSKPLSYLEDKGVYQREFNMMYKSDIQVKNTNYTWGDVRNMLKDLLVSATYNRQASSKDNLIEVILKGGINITDDIKIVDNQILFKNKTLSTSNIPLFIDVIMLNNKYQWIDDNLKKINFNYTTTLLDSSDSKDKFIYNVLCDILSKA